MSMPQAAIFSEENLTLTPAKETCGMSLGGWTEKALSQDLCFGIQPKELCKLI